MPKVYQWQEKYSCNLYMIDEQHQFFLRLLNRIGEEIEEAKGEEEKLRLIEELELFCKFHFLSEENLLRKRGFPQAEWMEKLHHSLLVGLVNREVLLECAQGDPGEVVTYLGDWFIRHIVEDDMKFSEYFHSGRC